MSKSLEGKQEPCGLTRDGLTATDRVFSRPEASCFTSLSAGEQGQQHLQHPGQPAFKDGAVRQQPGDPGGGAHTQLPRGEKEVVNVNVDPHLLD